MFTSQMPEEIRDQIRVRFESRVRYLRLVANEIRTRRIPNTGIAFESMPMHLGKLSNYLLQMRCNHSLETSLRRVRCVKCRVLFDAPGNTVFSIEGGTLRVVQGVRG